MSYKAIGFDYGGVVSGLPGSAFMQSMAELLNVPAETLRMVFFANNHFVNVEKTMTWVGLWQHIACEVGHPEEQASVAAHIEVWDKNQTVNQEVKELMIQLRAAGYRIGLFSNYAEGLRERLEEEGLTACFDVIGISSEMGAMKPSPEAFQKFCDLLQVEPHELIFIDDTKKSLETAEEVGYTPILFQDGASLRHELSALGVLQ